VCARQERLHRNQQDQRNGEAHQQLFGLVHGLAQGAKAIAADKRSIAAELSYYSRGHLPVKAWNTPGTPPSDHFEMVNPVTAKTPAPLLYIASNERVGCIGAHFGRIEKLGPRDFATGSSTSRRLYFYLLSEPQTAAFAAPPSAKPACLH
jgi:hypothetical protein